MVPPGLLYLPRSCSPARILSNQGFCTTKATLAHLFTPLLRPADFFLRPRMVLPVLPRLPLPCELPALPRLPSPCELPALPRLPLPCELPALLGLPLPCELPALTGLPCESPLPEGAFIAAFSWKHDKQNLARLLFAFRRHFLKFWHFFT